MNRNAIRIEVNGKVNLSLNITGRERQLHRVDTVMASVGLSDTVTVAERSDGRVNVTFTAPFAVPSKNTVVKTTDLLRARFGPLGADITVEKRLPLAGGLGGSSADCAAVLLALDKIYGLTATGLKTAETALEAGSDVPYMLTGGVCRVTGVGGTVESVACLKPLNLVLADGGTGVNTKDCYARFDELCPSGTRMPADNAALTDRLAAGDLKGVAAQMKNALTDAALGLAPSIGRTLEALSDAGAEAVFMSGSGSVCCGLFRDATQARSAAGRLRAGGLWAVETETKESGIRWL